MTRKPAASANPKARPKRAKMVTGRRATNGSARGAGGRTRPILKSAPLGLSSGDWLKIAGFVAALAGALVGYGQTQAKVDALVKEQDRQGKVLQSVYDHVAWGQGGTAGPAPPLPTK